MRVSDYDWPVVASTKPDHDRRGQYCSSPNHPGCISGQRHYQSKEFADYFHRLASAGSWQGFEGGRLQSEGGRDRSLDDRGRVGFERGRDPRGPSPSGGREKALRRHESAARDARERGAQLEDEMRGGDDRRGTRDRRRTPSPDRGRGRSRSPRRDSPKRSGGRRVEENMPIDDDDYDDYQDDDADDADGAEDGDDDDGDAPPRGILRDGHRSGGRGGRGEGGGRKGKGDGGGHKGKSKGDGRKGKGKGGKGKGKGGKLGAAVGASRWGGARGVSFSDGTAPSAASRLVPAALNFMAPFSKLLLIIVALVGDAQPAVLMPVAGGLIGSMAPASWKGTAALKHGSATATRWVPTLLGHTPSTPRAFHSAVQRFSPTHSNYLTIAITNCRSAPLDPSFSWYTLSDLEGSAEYIPSCVAVYRSLSFSEGSILGTDDGPISADQLMTADDALGSLGTYRIGAAAAAPPAQRLSRGYAREARCFEEMWRVHLDETAQLREVFSDPGPSLNVEQMVELRMPLQVGFGSPGSPSMGTTAASDDAVMSAAAAMDAVWAADCSIWLDRIRPGDPALLPPSLKEPGALAAFTDPVIATLEFKTRCVPPVTKPMTPPEPQRLAEVDGPTCIDGFYPPGHFRCKADPWLCHQHEYLLDVLQHGENSTVTPPDALVFADGERRAKYRGRLYEWSAERGIYVMTRTEAPVDTHLNREFAVLFSDGYPDQEMFGILWFGASFKVVRGGFHAAPRSTMAAPASRVRPTSHPA